MSRAIVFAATAVLAVVPACRTQFNERITGTAIGTGAGAIVGGLLGSAVGSTAGGAVLGGIAGGAAGYVIGDWLQDRRERAEGATEPMQRPAPPAAGSAVPDADTEYASLTTPVRAPRATTTVAQARREYEAGRVSLTAEEALAHYATAIRLDPSRPEPMNAQGLVYLYMGRKSEARASFLRALAADPTYAPAAHNLKRLAGA